METKFCKYCKQTKLIEEFEVANNINGKIYRRCKCKQCKKLTQKDRCRQLRVWFIEYKKTLKCNRCGYSDYRAIQFHHKDPKEKEYTLGDMPVRGYSKENILKEIEKCEVLCANCHSIEHYCE